MAEGDLKLVTDFAELRVGDLVEAECMWPDCEQTRHRALLLRPAEYKVFQHVSGPDTCELGYYMGQHRHGIELPKGNGFWATEFGVACRRVYKVDTGLEKSQEQDRHVGIPARDLSAMKEELFEAHKDLVPSQGGRRRSG